VLVQTIQCWILTYIQSTTIQEKFKKGMGLEGYLFSNKIIVNNNKTYYKKVFEGCTGLGFNPYTLFNQWLL
jgi:hypothetical protein